MKSIITLASAAMLTCYASAQPVINANNVAQNFNADFYFMETPTNFAAGPAGANQTWNFSGIGTGTLLGTDTVVPIAGTPYATTFPQANYLYKMNSPFLDADTYFYHKLTGTAFEIYSLGYDGDSGENYQENPRTYLTFPYSYNTIFTDTFKESSRPTASNITATYDAYGTLIMPFGTFTNVVRQKSVIDGVTNYSWFNVNPFYPILQTAFEDGIIAYMINNTVLGIDNPTATDLVAYPNPVKTDLHVKLPNGFSGQANVTVTDMSGKQLINETFDHTEPILRLEGLAPGMYIVRLKGTNGEFVSKIIKS